MGVEPDALWGRVKRDGFRLTPQRCHILKALAEAGRPQTAAEIHRRLGQECPELGLDTVYRNLRLLTALGVVNKIATARGAAGGRKAGQRADLFEVAEDHHHHRVCLGCGDIACLPGCPLPVAGAWSCSHTGFRVTGHVFEVYGYCARCTGGAEE